VNLEVIKNFLAGTAGIVFGVGFLVVGCVQLYLGYLGIEYHWGSIGAIICVVLAFLFRFMLPLTVGTFFGALDVWGWPWYGALALTAPGILFILPGLVAIAIGALSGRR
jgi:hypothetical protein